MSIKKEEGESERERELKPRIINNRVYRPVTGE